LFLLFIVEKFRQMQTWYDWQFSSFIFEIIVLGALHRKNKIRISHFLSNIRKNYKNEQKKTQSCHLHTSVLGFMRVIKKNILKQKKSWNGCKYSRSSPKCLNNLLDVVVLHIGGYFCSVAVKKKLGAIFFFFNFLMNPHPIHTGISWNH